MANRKRKARNPKGAYYIKGISEFGTPHSRVMNTRALLKKDTRKEILDNT